MDHKEMKILMISDIYPPISMGGYELSCKKITDELSRRGHKVTILTSKWGVERSIFDENVHRVLFINPSNQQNRPNIIDIFSFRKRYNQLLWAYMSRQNYKITFELLTIKRPDLVIFWNMADIGIGPILATQFSNIPGIFNLGDDWLVRLKSEFYDESNTIKKIFRLMISGLKEFWQLDLKHLLVVSKSLKQDYVNNGFPEQNIEVIPRGIHSSLILPIKDLNDLPSNHKSSAKFLFVGRIVPEKAPDIAIKAINILKQEYGVINVKFDIVGQGSKEYMLSLTNMVKELDLQDNVNFLGWLEQSQVFEKYADYDALLFPARWEEPIGNTVLEAMARGLPVIASNRGGPREIISNGENGLLVQVDDPYAIAKAIMQLFQSNELAQKIRIAGIKTISERYSLERIVDQNLLYIQNIIGTEKICGF
jgi:glycogen synthase